MNFKQSELQVKNIQVCFFNQRWFSFLPGRRSYTYVYTSIFLCLMMKQDKIRGILVYLLRFRQRFVFVIPGKCNLGVGSAMTQQGNQEDKKGQSSLAWAEQIIGIRWGVDHCSLTSPCLCKVDGHCSYIHARQAWGWYMAIYTESYLLRSRLLLSPKVAAYPYCVELGRRRGFSALVVFTRRHGESNLVSVRVCPYIVDCVTELFVIWQLRLVQISSSHSDNETHTQKTIICASE